MATFRYSVEIQWAGTGSPGVNTWHFRNEDQVDPLGTDLQDMIAALNAFYTSVRTMVPTTARFIGPAEVIKDPYGSPEYVGVTGFNVPGTGGGSYAPTASQICIGWRTTSATRRGRGRTFIGPLSSTTIEGDGTPTPTAVAAMQGAATTLVTTSKDMDQAAFGVYSQVDGVLRDFQSARVRDSFAVLRSRRD